MLGKLGVAPVTASEWSAAFACEVQPERFSAGLADVRPFVATFLHETGMLKTLAENMSYTAERICAVWPNRFPTIASARPYERDPRALANKVYGGRMGNTELDDGWNFRGRAAGITGRTNYAWLGDRWGQDLLVMPHMLEQPTFALAGSIHAWEGMLPDRHLSDQVKVRRIYNGGVIGLEHCQALYARGCKVIA
ncbi:hypothetical protein ASG30_09145 [Ramlibacter sp. Leaf400]|nr:hypothetical protein ASG30_09145 [Ramlibacter sp. Leaf400]